MNFNTIVFPAPAPSYTLETLQNIIWVPRSRFFSMKLLMKEKVCFENSSKYFSRDNLDSKKLVRIPCHYQKYTQDCKDIILYFHGNAEDLGNGANFAKRLSVGLKANILSVEYPGYGIYEGEPCSEAILEDAEIIFDFLLAELHIKPENIILLGRSIGSGAAIHLAANRKVRAMVLISAFTSLKDAIQNISGALVSRFVADRFKNAEEIKKVECPVLFIHGARDKLIPAEHSKILKDNCKSETRLYLGEKMTHNEFSVFIDVIEPIRSFFGGIGVTTDYGGIDLPCYLVKAPLKQLERRTSLISKIVDGILTKY